MVLSYFTHRQACLHKRREQAERLDTLPPTYRGPLSPADKAILARPISTLIHDVQTSALAPLDVLTAYAKRAVQAHAQTNCLTEVMLADAAKWAQSAPRTGPLAGVPVSLKDMLAVRGFDTSLGYSAYVGAPAHTDSALVRLLRAAGAVPIAKTNVPVTMLAFETANDVFGRTENPHRAGFSPGGSSGGEAALLALGGTRIGCGTDVAGSVRVPAHWSGVYAIRSSAGRFPKTGSATTIPGQEGVPATHSPMAKTLEDLETFWRGVFQMKPWEYDHTVLEMPWKEVSLDIERPIRWGVLWDDGVVAPSPACLRALRMVTDVLEKNGHQVITLAHPSAYEGLQIASQLLMADGGKTVSKPLRYGETIDAGMTNALRALRLPRFVMRLYAWYLHYIRRDPVYAGLVAPFREKTVEEYYALIARREDYRARWFRVWRGAQVEGALGDEGVDFVLTVPNALPAIPHRGMRHGWKACGYTFLFNLLDYSAGVMPVTQVSAAQDVLLASFRARNAIERENYRMYDPCAMEGLPVGVQVVGRRLDEERVLAGMQLVQALLRDAGLAYRELAV